MKVHYINILLFALPLNILVTSYVYNKNKPSITSHHTPRYTSRVLSECDTESSIYDNDEEINSVKEIFERQTSQRFQEYEERMKDKRQKRIEQRDKNIQKIIHKDKMEKNLAEKIEKGCLMCGCALGGGVLPVWGLVGGLWYATLSQYVTKMATDEGIKAGIATVVSELKDVANPIDISGVVNAETYRCPNALIASIYAAKDNACAGRMAETGVCTSLGQGSNASSFNIKVIGATTKGITAARKAQADKVAELTAKSSHVYNAIGYSVLAILIIVLVMLIIYLVLRYRRKKKMNKKAQYTKLLNQ
ncbi:rifin [Plasmodium reichenowi]|uniref:Rifin n=1 Tax=Plasmodium reichenowi TaxID=5854 RepID=A0A060RM28_PLARE|nr:rifin [Plasmodium reichenowi]